MIMTEPTPEQYRLLPLPHKVCDIMCGRVVLDDTLKMENCENETEDGCKFFGSSFKQLAADEGIEDYRETSDDKDVDESDEDDDEDVPDADEDIEIIVDDGKSVK